jgi:serine/threonine-protein kinase
MVCPRDKTPTEEIRTEEFSEDKFLGKYVGSYQLITSLGVGGMGAVYAAEHPTLKKKVAVKVLHEEFARKPDVIDRFFAEARVIASLGHPNLVEVTDFGVLDNTYPYFIMEFLSGEPLKQRLRREGRIPLQEALVIGKQLLDALKTVHAEGVIHRDIKPDNIFLARKPKQPETIVKLLDFGVAKMLDPRTRPEGLQSTKSGMIIGTPQYMSPEQVQGYTSQIDARADLYSVGVVFFEMLCGQLPFPGSTFGELVIAHVLTTPPSACALNPNLSPQIDAFLQKSLAKTREERFQSAEEMAIAFATAAGEAPRTPEPDALATLEESDLPPDSGTLRAVFAAAARSAAPQASPSDMQHTLPEDAFEAAEPTERNQLRPGGTIYQTPDARANAKDAPLRSSDPVGITTLSRTSGEVTLTVPRPAPKTPEKVSSARSWVYGAVVALLLAAPLVWLLMQVPEKQVQPAPAAVPSVPNAATTAPAPDLSPAPKPLSAPTASSAPAAPLSPVAPTSEPSSTAASLPASGPAAQEPRAKPEKPKKSGKRKGKDGAQTSAP